MTNRFHKQMSNFQTTRTSRFNNNWPHKPRRGCFVGVCSACKIVVQTYIFETYLHICLVLGCNITYFNIIYYFGDFLIFLHNIVQRYNQNVRPKSSILTTNKFKYCISQVWALGWIITIIPQYFSSKKVRFSPKQL